jgi:hypothetical protein
VISGFRREVDDKCALPFIVRVLVISYWLSGQPIGRIFKGQELKGKPVFPIRSLYREECGWWKVSVAWCQPIGLMQVVGRQGTVEMSRNVGKNYPTGCVITQKNAVLMRILGFTGNTLLYSYIFHVWVYSTEYTRKSKGYIWQHIWGVFYVRSAVGWIF